MKKMMMMVAACAAMMTANAAVVSPNVPDIGVKLTGVYIAEGRICVTTSKALESIGHTYHIGMQFRCEKYGDMTSAYLGIGEHSVAIPADYIWESTEDVRVLVYEFTERSPNVHHLVTTLGVIHVDEGSWYSWGTTGDLVYGLPEVIDEEDEETIEPTPTEPDPTPTEPEKSSKCPVISFFRKIFSR